MKKPRKTSGAARRESGAGRYALRSREAGLASGRALRQRASRSRHGAWKPHAKRRDPIDILEESNQDRLSDLVPIRYGRMLRSPFTFLRGSAALMAHDLANTPSTGLHVQACGDCHLLNFGLFATPERNLVVDLNDFDETLPAPWEWDLKRLTVSFIIAGRDNKVSESSCKDTVRSCVRSYREHLREYSRKSAMDVWYDRMDVQTLIDNAPDGKTRKFRQRLAKEARERVVEHLFPKIAGKRGGRHHIVDQPPLLFHARRDRSDEFFAEALEAYRATLPDERRVLLDRHVLQDVAVKVVGIGSVGTRCFIALYLDEQGHPLLLQVKEARRSVLEPYAGKSAYELQGQRVVMGQRLMQSSSDIFLGWARGRRGRDYYVRQLRDMKLSVPVEGLSAEQLVRYARGCGWVLARAHAKSGDATAISGYLGKGDAFDEALVDFSVAYADQTGRDHAALVKAVGSGKVKALVDV
ncbi:MAG TPA: DUF2252 domain-containing protein [Planctomycetota bacterium]|nr:DUF2252 domain-containing protein [Planctomycetota bacterium]